jgi:hypothetical protein
MKPIEKSIFDRIAEESAQASEGSSPSLPDIELPCNGRSISTFAGELGRLLRPHPIFIRNGCVVCLSDKRFGEILPTSFVTWVEHYVRPFKFVGKTDPMIVSASMSEKTAATCLSSEQFRKELRAVERVNPIRQPIIRPDGSLELLPTGYDELSKTYTFEEVTYQTDLSVDEGKRALEELLSEFPWKNSLNGVEQSKSLAMMLTTFGDPLIAQEHQRPAFLVKATREGSGKTLLLRLGVCPTHGPAIIDAPTKGEELSKKILTILKSGRPYFIIDNVRGQIGDPTLEAFLTSSTYSDRVLGSSTEFSAKVQCLVFLSGNNARVNGDMRRRSIIIELDLEEAESETREIKHPLTEAGILRRRPNILAALWSLIRNWDDQGRPAPKILHRSFHRWSEVFGSIVETNGYPSPCIQPEESSDDTLRDMKVLLASIITEAIDPREGLSLLSSELMEKARTLGLFEWVLGEEAPEREDIKRKERSSFAKICSRFDSGTKFRTSEGFIRFEKEKAAARTPSGSSSKRFRVAMVPSIE